MDRAPPRRLAMLGYQGPISLPLLGPRVAGPMLRAILRFGRGGASIDPKDTALFGDHIPPRVSVAMYRTFLVREVLSIVRGRYKESVLEVPTTLLVGSEDLVSRGVLAGPVAGQPALRVEVLPQVGHWLPEQRPEAIAEWLGRA